MIADYYIESGCNQYIRQGVVKREGQGQCLICTEAQASILLCFWWIFISIGCNLPEHCVPEPNGTALPKIQSLK